MSGSEVKSFQTKIDHIFEDNNKNDNNKNDNNKNDKKEKETSPVEKLV